MILWLSNLVRSLLADASFEKSHAFLLLACKGLRKFYKSLEASGLETPDFEAFEL